MAISAKKKARIERDKRIAKVNARSMDGKGRFLDATAEMNAWVYLDSGDETFLNRLPDYRLHRAFDAIGRGNPPVHLPQK